jgi:hypothetical protein
MKKVFLQRKDKIKFVRVDFRGGSKIFSPFFSPFLSPLKDILLCGSMLFFTCLSAKNVRQAVHDRISGAPAIFNGLKNGLYWDAARSRTIRFAVRFYHPKRSSMPV